MCFQLLYDGLAVVVNRTNSVTNLSAQQLFDIYKGEIKNWKEVGGADQPIAVVTREASSARATALKVCWVSPKSLTTVWFLISAQTT